MNETFVPPPHADRHMLQSEDLRRRQLRSALLHGSGRSWRERPRIWPAALAGVVIVAVIVAAIGVYGAFQRQRTILEQEEQRRRPANSSSTWDRPLAGRE